MSGYRQTAIIGAVFVVNFLSPVAWRLPDACAGGPPVDCHENGLDDGLELSPLDGHALLFNGVDQYADLGLPDALRELGEVAFTLEMWVRITDARRSILIGNFDGSPCIDAGDNAAVPPDLADLDGDGNTGEATPLEVEGRWRFHDDAITADTGSGTNPTFDIGAHGYGSTTPIVVSADLDYDGDVDLYDHSVFLTQFVGPR